MTTQSPPPQEMLAQADLLLLLADLLRPPRAAAQRCAPVDAAEIDALLAAAGFAARAELAAAIRLASAAQARTPIEALGDEHHRLFEGAMVCPLNETAYIRRDKGVLLGDIAGFYRAFGWQADGRNGEKPDHLLTELEFTAILLVMAARAAARDHREAEDTTRAALAAFADSHLGDWLPLVCRHLGQCAALEYHQHLAAALVLTWDAVVQSHGWTLTLAPSAAAQPSEPMETPYECDAAASPEPVDLTLDGQVPTYPAS